MNVCIIEHDNLKRFPAHYQVMVPVRCGFNHVFPGKLFTLEDAQTICTENGYNVLGIGNIWKCDQYCPN